MLRRLTLTALVTTCLLACGDTPDPLQVEPTGVVQGLIYIDRDGNEALTQNFDVSASGAIAGLVREGSGDTVATATAGTDGTFFMRDVPVGEYRLVSGRGVLGDSLELQDIDSVRVKVASGDTVTRVIRYGFPATSVLAARSLPLNRRVILRGVALNALGTDTTIHIQDPTGALRATRVLTAGPIQEGDSIRMVGLISTHNGRPVIDQPITTVVGGARSLAPPEPVSTQQAASADGGRLADQRVSIARAEVRDTATIPFYHQITVNDGSGDVDVLYRLDGNRPNYPPAAFEIGALVDIRNALLIAGPGGVWQLKPRGPTDVTAAFPTRTIAEARSMELNKRVQIAGIALNRLGVFNDSTLHIQDATGAMRVIRLTQFVGSVPAENDSVRVVGTTAFSDGGPVLLNAVVTVVTPAARIVPVDSVSTADAASAVNGTRADSHVRIANAAIQDTATLPSLDRLLTVDDGSGPLEIVLSRFYTFSGFIPGGKVTARGLLVPVTGSTKWRLKPRNAGEASVTVQTLSIDAVRALAPNTVTFVDGIALNASTAFGDSTVHIADNTGALRAIRVRSPVNAGDSVRFNGTTDVENGSPILRSVQSTVLRAGVGVPAADSISLADMSTAAGGTLDAALVKVGGAVVGVQTRPNGDVIALLEDASGTGEVLFKARVGAPGLNITGTVMTVTGLLVRSAAGTWQILPRSRNDDVTIDLAEVTVEEARSLDVGKNVYIRGVALNSYFAFRDSTIHIRSGGVAIRVIRHPATNISAGDSVRIPGTTDRQNGQPVLIGGNGSTVLRANVGVPVPDSISTGVAAAADGGTRDANAVAISGTITAVDTLTTAPGLDLSFTLNDGTGPIQVVIDKDLSLATGAYVKNAFIRVRGVLIPETNGTKWLIKPRTAADIGLSTPPAPPEPTVRRTPDPPQ